MVRINRALSIAFALMMFVALASSAHADEPVPTTTWGFDEAPQIQVYKGEGAWMFVISHREEVVTTSSYVPISRPQPTPRVGISRDRYGNPVWLLKWGLIFGGATRYIGPVQEPQEGEKTSYWYPDEGTPRAWPPEERRNTD